ncbi:MAG TPA: AbrB/MazE/SpoVT family DNA-binding domain-containing protein [Candidatus Saccharimonadales bacterium]|nr:AbrB/MazE/SpoVT family DNA-binding domain-containing protein [Candidatus Saccharimonadales bacterium]
MAEHSFPKILGTATLNEKGQLVIPSQARADMGLKSGSKVVIMASTQRQALVILKAEEVEAMLQDFSDALSSDN